MLPLITICTCSIRHNTPKAEMKEIPYNEMQAGHTSEVWHPVVRLDYMVR